MNETRNQDGTRTIRRAGAIGLLTMLLLSSGVAPAQTASPRPPQRALVVGQQPGVAYAPAVAWGTHVEAGQLPQDIRIMQRIVSTALGEVEAPELPAALREPQSEDSEEAATTVYSFGGTGAVVWPGSHGSGRMVHIGGRDITGFYMQGYGYLFTVEWRVAGRFGEDEIAWGMRSAELAVLADEARRVSGSAQEAESRAADEARSTLEAERRRVEAQREAWQEWAGRYRTLLAEELRAVVAQYGSTLNRAQADEAITFIADFGGGESETVTVSARRGELSGAGRDQNLGAVRLARGEAQVSDSLRTEIKIMAAILDSSLQGDGDGGLGMVYVERAWYGGDSNYQYVPGYGVLFRKPARLNLATRVIQQVTPMADQPGAPSRTLRQRIEESTEDQRDTYAEHLEGLKQSTAGILATYGPTLTEMGPDEWVGVYYDVGSAAGLLEGGISNFLVQARMGDIRQAASQGDPTSWLLGRLVTNEKPE